MDLALFDFDGTITTRDTLPDFVMRTVPRVRLAAGRVLLAPMYVGYRAGRVSGVAMRAAIARIGFTGLSTSHVHACGRAFAHDMLPALIRPTAMARIDWHRRRGDRVIVVSGGFDFYLAPWAATHGLELLCSTLDHRDGRFSGRYAGLQCVRHEKVARVRAIADLDAFDAVHAYGDSIEDHAMLAIADHAHYRSMPAADGDAHRATN